MSDFKPNLTKTTSSEAEITASTPHDHDTHLDDYEEEFDEEDKDNDSETVLTNLMIHNMTAVAFFLMGMIGLYNHIEYAGWGIAIGCLMVL